MADVMDYVHIRGFELMMRRLYKSCYTKGWCSTKGGQVALRIPDSQGTAPYIAYPRLSTTEEDETNLVDVAGYLSCNAIVTISNHTISVIMDRLPPNATSLYITDNLKISVIDEFDDILEVQKQLCATFVRNRKCLLVWANDVKSLIPFSIEIERRLVERVWREKTSAETQIAAIDDEKAIIDLEGGALKRKRAVFIVPLSASLAFLILGLILGLDAKILVYEIRLDGSYWRLFLILYLPLLVFFCSFFINVVAGVFFHLFGPISQVRRNSKYYSGTAPVNKLRDNLPRITVQCPVYKESLEEVIQMTVESTQKAISTYQLQGGSATIFINDDGLQLLSEEEANKRRAFYEANDIGWVARPPHGKNGFVRAGHFKKASNMNYSLHIASQLEDKLESIERNDHWTEDDEKDAYEVCLKQVVQEQKHETWAGGDIRIGELVLLLDSDSRIPADCFLDAATEFHDDPEVAIIQHSSGVMQVVNDFWENGIAYFTRLIYFAIRYVTAGGDVSPFVGHNAFLRWSAVQEMSWEQNGQRLWWSETSVSEDFDLALKLQNLGYIIRLASYTNNEFKEGVSLTVYDELSRWEKYAYGCSEMMFNPIKEWPRKGPFNPLIIKFITSQMPLYSKFTILSYIGTYYAIGSAWVITLLDYILFGFFQTKLDHFWMSSFNIFVAVIIVFNIASPFVHACLRYRLREAPLSYALYENYKWMLLLMIFLGGISMHVSKALLCHLFSIPMDWGATAKTLEKNSFMIEIPKIYKRFRWMYLFVFLLIALMLVFAYAVPWQWRVTGFFTTLPLGWLLVCHALLPIVLNPQSYLSEFH